MARPYSSGDLVVDSCRRGRYFLSPAAVGCTVAQLIDRQHPCLANGLESLSRLAGSFSIGP